MTCVLPTLDVLGLVACQGINKQLKTMSEMLFRHDRYTYILEEWKVRWRIVEKTSERHSRVGCQNKCLAVLSSSVAS